MKLKDITVTQLALGFTIIMLGINFVGDYTFRGGQIEINETMGKAWTTQVEINTDQNKINVLVAEVLIQLDEDVRNNFKVVDQLIGIILRDEA